MDRQSPSVRPGFLQACAGQKCETDRKKSELASLEFASHLPFLSVECSEPIFPGRWRKARTVSCSTRRSHFERDSDASDGTSPSRCSTPASRMTDQSPESWMEGGVLEKMPLDPRGLRTAKTTSASLFSR